MAEQSAQDYLHQLELSQNQADRDLAKRLRDAQGLTIVETPAEKASRSKTTEVKPTGTGTETKEEKPKLPISSKQPRHYGS